LRLQVVENFDRFKKYFQYFRRIRTHMLDFRKVLLAAAVASLGLVSTASAQLSGCTLVSGALGGVRTEGVTEQLPQVQITLCAGTSNTGTLSFQVTTNAPVTNVITNATSNATDAIATIGGIPQPGGSLSTVAGTLLNPTTLQFQFTITPGGPVIVAGTATISINNIRVNASSVPVGTTLTAAGTGVTGMIFGTAAGASTTSPAVTQTSLAKPSFAAYSSVAICNIKPGDVNAVGTVVVKDAFLGAFTSDIQEALKEPGIGPLPAAPGNTLTAASMIGSRIALTFNNLTNGVTYYLPVTVSNPIIGAGAVNFNLALVSNPASGALGIVGGTIGGASTNGGNTTTLQGGGTVFSPTAGGTGNGSVVSGVASFTPTNGSFTAYYAISNLTGVAPFGDNNGAFIDTTGAFAAAPPIAAGTTITLYETVPNTQLVPSALTPTVTAALTGAAIGSAGYGQYSATNTTAAATATTATLVPGGALTSCNTTLLFPYVINTGGYDTGIAISNSAPGTSVPGGLLTTTASGTCTLNLWGAGSLNGTAVTPFATAPITVASGQVFAFTLSSALAPTANASGFAGYAVASCNFQGGHGFAFITDGFGTTPGRGLSQGYLAPILSEVYNGLYVTPGTATASPQF
jgi:hypothetical protein